MQLLEPITGSWRTIREPRTLLWLQMLVYTLVLAAGVAGLIKPPVSLLHSLGVHLTIYWGTLLVIGGALGLVAIPHGRWWLERAGIVATMTGIAMYLVVIIEAHFRDDRPRMTQVCLVAALLIHFTMRWYRIRRYRQDPEKLRR